MKDNQFYIDGRLYRFDYSGTGQPWPLYVWDDETQTWQAIGMAPGLCQASSLLTTGHMFSVLTADWLQETSGELVTSVDGDPISCTTPTVVAIPEFVLTDAGDVIGVGGA